MGEVLFAMTSETAVGSHAATMCDTPFHSLSEVGTSTRRPRTASAHSDN